MKKAYTNSNDVVHLFAQQTQTEARCGNVFFYGSKIYSYGYHYLLGEFITPNTIMINDKGYSVTTSKHISQLSYATRQYKQFRLSETDLKSVLYICKENLNKLKTARKPIKYISEINRYFNALNVYLDWAKKNKQYKNQKSTSEYREIKAIHKLANSNTDNLKELFKKEVARKKASIKKEVAKKYKEFLNYDINTFRVGNKDFLRVSKDGLKVETSQGIKIDIKECILLYKMIVAKKDIKGYRIGWYNVTSINGTLKIGCHNIDIDSVHKVGKQII